MITLPPTLRLALVPIGLALATRGLSYLSDENERLSMSIEARRAILAAWEYPACVHRPDAAETHTTPCTECPPDRRGYPPYPAPPEDLPSAASSSTPATGNPPVRRRRRWLRVLGTVAAFGAGAYAARRAQEWLHDRQIEQAAHAHAAAAFRGEIDPPEAEEDAADQNDMERVPHGYPCDGIDCPACRQIRKQ